MRILWIRRGASGPDAGDTIYDDKLQRALAGRFAITNCLLTRNSRPHQLLGAALTLNLPEQYGSGTRDDEARVRALLPQHDLAIFSHEHLDRFARAMRPHTDIPFLTLRQNVTSDAMASILETTPALAAVYRTLAAQQERAALRGPLFQAVAGISARDLGLLRTLSQRDVTLVLPGAPPASPLAPDAPLRRDVVISGTYDWFPKARDIRQFTDEYMAAPVPGAQVYAATGVPQALRAALNAQDESALDLSAAIRFGVITDRFTAGHKLKTAAYLMNNCVVISFAHISDDFTAFPAAKRWIFEVKSAAEIGPVMDEVLSRPADAARAEFLALKHDIAAALNWKTQAQALANAIETALLKPDAMQHRVEEPLAPRRAS